MATAIPAADLKVFPSADDINAGDVGAGNIVTEENLIGLLKSMPPKNFIISGFVLAHASDTTVTITQGEAFIGGYYVQTDTTQTYTIAPAVTAAKVLYFYLTLNISGTVTGATISNTTEEQGTIPAVETADSVLLGAATTDNDGDIEAAGVEQSKRNYGGGIYSGTYVGDGNTTQSFVLGFAPSFVYVAGEATGSGSNIVAASALIPAGARTLNASGVNRISDYYTCGWCMVSSSTMNTHPKFYTGTATWADGSIVTNTWGTQEVTIGGVRRGDLVAIGGDNFFDGGVASNAVSTESILRDIDGGEVWFATPVAPGYMNKDDGEIGYVFGNPTTVYNTNRLVIGAYASADDTVTWGMYNCDSGDRTPNSAATASFVVQSAWEMQTSTQFFLDTTISPTSEIRPSLRSTGFSVSSTAEGVAGSGETLNKTGQKYNYWAFS